MRARRTMVLALAALAVLPARGARGHRGLARGLGDLRRGRTLGGQHQRVVVAHGRARADRVLRRRAGGESTPGCHRSKSAEVHIGDGVTSVNLACSGARTYSRTSDGKFKPGHRLLLQRRATRARRWRCRSSRPRDKDIKTVVVLIGANDYGFADIVQTCVTNWLTSPSWWKNYCQDDSNMVAMFSAANITTITDQRAQRVQPRQAGDGQRAATPTSRSTRSSPRPTPRRCRRPRASATARPASRARRSAAAASGTATPTGPATRSSTRSTTRSRTPIAGMSNVQAARHGRRAQRPQAVREHGRAARGEGRRDLADRGRGRTRPSGCTRSARSRRSSRPTSCRRTRTRTTGASSRCATASARPTTAAPLAAGAARAGHRAQRQGRAEHDARTTTP